MSTARQSAHGEVWDAAEWFRGVHAHQREGQPMVLPAMVVGGGVQWPGGIVALNQGGLGLG